jgi:hypothetical protein
MERDLLLRLTRRGLVAKSAILLTGAPLLAGQEEASGEGSALPDFVPEDLPLLLQVMDLHPHLPIVAAAVKKARELLTYPIDRADVLLSAFDRKTNTVKLTTRDIHSEEVHRFMPAEYFPIEDEREFMCKLLMAFQRGDVFHAFEGKRQSRRESSNAVVIPAPRWDESVLNF